MLLIMLLPQIFEKKKCTTKSLLFFDVENHVLSHVKNGSGNSLSLTVSDNIPRRVFIL